MKRRNVHVGVCHLLFPRVRSYTMSISIGRNVNYIVITKEIKFMYLITRFKNHVQDYEQSKIHTF